MPHCSVRQVVEVTALSFLLAAFLGCGHSVGPGDRPGDQADDQAGDQASGPGPGVSVPVEVADDIAATMEPSALQMELAALAPASAQPPSGVHKRIDAAVESYLQRIHTNRIYIAVDKPLYRPGETIWFRTWELGTPDLLAATASGQGMTAQLISPKGAAVIQKRIAIAKGVARNDFQLPAGVPGGEYIIRALSDTGTRAERKVIVSSYQPPRIKKKLEFIRKAYGPGDEVSAALALNRATGEPLSTASGPTKVTTKVTAIAQVDGSEVARQPVTTSATGTAIVKFKLPTQMYRGEGLLTILVEDGGLVESIQKPIPITLKEIRFALYPEGGDLVVGMPGRVYFAARTLIDKPADVQGKVVDDQGVPVAEFASFHDGMGRFELTPQKGRSYRVHITRPVGIEQTFPLPDARAHGCSLQAIDDFSGQRDDIRVAVSCTQGLTVIATATLRERRIATQSVEVAARTPSVIALPSPRWQQGAVRVTVFSERGAPLAERVIYRGHGNDMNIAIKTDRASYAPRDRVRLDIETTDLAGKPVAADLALAVVDDTVLSFADDKTAHLFTQMYLAHELVGQEIHEPNFYFSDDPKAGSALDLVLGTAGWRRFAWRQVLSPDYGGVQVDGETWDEDNGYRRLSDKPARKSRTPGQRQRARKLRVLGRERVPAGRAGAEGALGSDNTLLAQAGSRGTIAGMVRDQNGKPLAGVRVDARSVTTYRGSLGHTDKAGRYSIKGLTPGMYNVTFSYMGVTAYQRASVRIGKTTDVNGRIDTRQAVEEDESEPEAPMAARPVRRRPEPKVADMPEPAVAPEAEPPPPPPPAVPAPDEPMFLPMAQGKLEEKNVQGGQNRIGGADKDWKGNQKAPAPAWAVVREFPAPSYKPGYDGPRTDFRETIYWAPLVRTDESGKATISFSLSDAVTSFRATVEGASSSGVLGRAETLVRSKLPVSLAAKLPLEVSAGDRIELPVTISNETSRTLSADIRASFGPAFKVVGKAPRRMSLTGGARESLFYSLRVVGDGKRPEDGRMALTVEAAGLRDEVEQVVKVVPLGFPQEISLAGTVADKARHDVVLAGALPGTISASMTMYPSPLATMVKGTEGLIREPSGCFEQASSTNYPNVMVLAYLDSHNAANPELVQKTHGVLERGYRKLTGYESPKRGYEWFGGDPGHEALTAYGLMEFVDMAQVYADTDHAMIRRTAGWLASRRDGKGGYQRNKRALDSFGRAADEVTNGYITWALSKASRARKRGAGGKPGNSLGIDLSAELRYQKNIAKTTKDPYLMALAAGTMVNLGGDNAGDNSETAAALARLAGMRAKDGSYPGADHSITRSGGVALTIESTALAVLALLGDGDKYMADIRPSIEWLDKQRSGFGRYGSTQSTILSLEAMTRYAQATRATRSPGTAALLVNGKKVKTVRFAAGREGALEFGDVARFFKPGKNRVEVTLDAKQSMPYSVAIGYRSKLPRSSEEAKIAVSTHLDKADVPWGEGVRMTATIRNLSDDGAPMTLARIGLPGGLTYQTWQLKELREKGVIDFYETRDREVIVYFRSLAPKAEKTVDLALLASIPGTYVAPASSAYLYYTDEFKHWAEPVRVSVARKK